ncbi:hypothetical protein BC830DRAFT_1125492 [Chytriomyces sp. MP71]|nr:hypothetical protein BC830DRAFT_1125492 [Chytriomyces sp. MP71]
MSIALPALVWLAVCVAANTEKTLVRTGASDQPWLLGPQPHDGCLVPPFAKITLNGTSSSVCLRGLQPRASYEVRVCWPATTPGDYALIADPATGTLHTSVVSSGVLMPGLDASLYNTHMYHLILESTAMGVVPFSAIPVLVLCLVLLVVVLRWGVPLVEGLILEGPEGGRIQHAKKGHGPVLTQMRSEIRSRSRSKSRSRTRSGRSLGNVTSEEGTMDEQEAFFRGSRAMRFRQKK